MKDASRPRSLLEQLKEKEFRDAFVTQHISTGIPFQIRVLRESRNWSQQRLGDEAGMVQTAVSRLEDVNYGRFTLSTLQRLASAFDVALLVKFVPFSKFLKETEDLSLEALSASSFEEEVDNILRLPDFRENFSASTPVVSDSIDTSGGTRIIEFPSPKLDFLMTDETEANDFLFAQAGG